MFLLQTAAPRSDTIRGMTATGHPRRFVIAVVDDDRSVLESLAMLLASAEYDVRLFESL